jgi:hypothetical protein
LASVGLLLEPELVEEDLLRMKSLGINMVSIQANDPQYYRNLLDFTADAQRTAFTSTCSAAWLRRWPSASSRCASSSRPPDWPIIRRIMAYDTIWEPGNYVFQGDRRAGWDSAWRAWVIEQYGSIEAAEADWQFQGRRDSQQRLTSPPDQHFQRGRPVARDDGRLSAVHGRCDQPQVEPSASQVARNGPAPLDQFSPGKHAAA